jgi:hypothetical protein
MPVYGAIDDLEVQEWRSPSSLRGLEVTVLDNTEHHQIRTLRKSPWPIIIFSLASVLLVVSNSVSSRREKNYIAQVNIEESIIKRERYGSNSTFVQDCSIVDCTIAECPTFTPYLCAISKSATLYGVRPAFLSFFLFIFFCVFVCSRL